MRAFLFLLASLIVFGCNREGQGSDENILYQNKILHEFSTPQGKDTFLLKVVGDSLLKSDVVFQIISPKDSIVYEEKFTSLFLIDFGLHENASPLEMEAYIKNRLDHFFDEKNFYAPAINPAATFDPDYSDKLIWEEIKADSSAIGFYFLLGKEDGRNISFSRKRQKTVLYFNCC